MKSEPYNKYNANYIFSPISQVYFMLCSVLTSRKLFTKSFMIIRSIAITFVFLCCKQGFLPSKVKALCKQKCKLSRGIPGLGLLSAELYTFEISIAATAFSSYDCHEIHGNFHTCSILYFRLFRL